MARPERFELPTPRFVVYGYPLILNRNSANLGQISPRRINGLSSILQTIRSSAAMTVGPASMHGALAPLGHRPSASPKPAAITASPPPGVGCRSAGAGSAGAARPGMPTPSVRAAMISICLSRWSWLPPSEVPPPPMSEDDYNMDGPLPDVPPPGNEAAN
jgi:hypothetical protein